MAKSVIVNVVTDKKINTTYVTYSTGTEKLYSADKLPKTVQTWLEKNMQEESEVEEPAAPEVTEDSAKEPEVDEPRQTHAEPLRTLLGKQANHLSLDIVDAIVGALLIASRWSLLSAAYFLAGASMAIKIGVFAYERLIPYAMTVNVTLQDAYRNTEEHLKRFGRYLVIVYPDAKEKAVKGAKQAIAWAAISAWSLAVIIGWR